jgi:tetratricopeptide (TPR) repeat protein
LDKRLTRYESQFVPQSRAGRIEAIAEKVQKNPRDAALQTEFAIALRRARKAELARQALTKALSIDSKFAQARFALAELDAAEDKPEAAVKTLRTMMADSQDGYSVQMLLSRLLAANKDVAGAKTALLAAQKWDPTQAAPLYALSEMAVKAGAADEELDALRKLALLEQHEPRVYQRLLRALNERKLYDESVKVGEAAINADMTGSTTHILFAEALQASGDKKRARYEFESAVLCPAEDEEKAEAYARLAEFELANGQRAAAKKAAETAKRLHPDNARLRELKL